LSEFAKLPAPIERIRNPENYPVEQSLKLQEHRARVEQQVRRLQ